jgi:DtxR family Mn-dependent transcriptional regulator
LIERMASALGDPSHDPHGAPIPSREGEVDEPTLRTLADAAVGEQVRVRQVMDKDAERLRYLAELGIRPGALVRILERAPFDGPITVGVGRAGAGVTRVIGPALAEQVFVEPFGAD